MASIPDKDERCQRTKRLIASGMGVCASCREAGVSEKTYYRWRYEKGECHAECNRQDVDAGA